MVIKKLGKKETPKYYYQKTIYDDEHSSREDRWITIGLIPAGKILVVVHTDRVYIDKNEVIRIISARKASEKEIRDYYNLNKR